jgi:1,4-dihydroxy-6-naphthoate synthase
MTKAKIRIAHSPDSDDAFMFYAIRNNCIDLGDLEFEFASEEIENLNQLALEKDLEKLKYDVYAISFHAYPYLQDRFQILGSGASMANKTYGPRLVCKEKLYNKLTAKNNYNPEKISLGLALKDKNVSYRLRIAIPGEYTSANLCLKLFSNINNLDFAPVYCKFDEVFDYVEQGKADAGLLIHESQIQFKDEGYHLILDLGAWWYQLTGALKMPLGTNVIRRDLDFKLRKQVAEILERSISYGLDNFEDALEYARKFSNNGLDDERAVEYINMYVNESSRALSVQDVKSIEFMYAQAFKYKLLDNQIKNIKIDLL